MTSARAMSSRARAVSRPGSPGPGADEVGGHDAEHLARAGAQQPLRPTSAPRRSGSVAVELVAHPGAAVGGPDEGAQRQRVGGGGTCAWAPTGVWQSASSARTSARSAASARADGACVDRRDERLLAGAGGHGQAALAGGGDELVQRRARVAAAQALQPGGGQHDRVVVAVGRACAGGCRRCRAARRRRGRRAARAAGRPGAATTCPRAPPRPARRASPRRTARRAGRRAAGTAAMTMPSGQLPRARPWPSARRSRRRRRSSAASSSRTQRSLSERRLAAVAAASRPRPARARRRAARPPGAPAPGPARCRASRSSRPALERADVVGRRRLGRRLGRRR